MNYTKENLIYRSIYQKIQKSSIPKNEKIEKYENLMKKIENNYSEIIENFDLWFEIKFEVKKLKKKILNY